MRGRSAGLRPALQGLVKAFHTGAFALIQTCILYLIWSGLTRRTGRLAAMATGIAAAETAIYVGNGFRCPLTGLAERLGADSGQVTDIFLPRWLANNIANIYCPLFSLGLYLNARNLVSANAVAEGSEGPVNRAGSALHRP